MVFGLFIFKTFRHEKKSAISVIERQTTSSGRPERLLPNDSSHFASVRERLASSTNNWQLVTTKPWKFYTEAFVI